MELLDKLTILADAAKYDAACTSSGLDRAGRPGGLGSTLAAGCCHSFSADGRCISLLKVLLTNRCVYDCAYCVNRRSSDVRRAAFTPRELAELTIGFYRRNYIEGLFLSSAVWGGPDRTTEAMIEALRLLREEYGFRGYIHAKAIPGADPLLTRRLGLLADRLSVNIELPSEESLGRLAPDKAKAAILAPMAQIRDGIQASRGELARFRHAPRFAPAGQSTQMIIGATPESDRHILTLTQALYDKYKLKRVFYSAYMPVSDSALLPARRDFKPPLLREHRLYQADWLLRFYHFRAEELLDEANPNFNPLVDPKCSWALILSAASPACSRYWLHSVTKPKTAPMAPAVLKSSSAGAHLCGAEKAGGGAQAGPVFPHLRRQVPGGPAGLPRRGAPPPGGPGAAHAAPGRAGAALPLRADGLGGGHGLDTGFLCL